jgi:predicted nuclease with RNAse H fold
VTDVHDLITVTEHRRALAIVRLLEENGIRHVEVWPEDMLSNNVGFVISGKSQPLIRLRPRAAPAGPYHVLVALDSLPAAQAVLARPGAEAQLERLSRQSWLSHLLWSQTLSRR